MLDGALVSVLAAVIHLGLLAYSATPGASTELEKGLVAVDDVEITEDIIQVKAADIVDRARPQSGFPSGQVFSRTCAGKCGSPSPIPGLPCQCHAGCLQAGNCCSDFNDLCNSCKSRCGDRFNPKSSCQCNSLCHLSRDCCPDFGTTCKALAQSQSTQRPSFQATSTVLKCKNITITIETEMQVKEVCRKNKKNKRRKHKKPKKNKTANAEAFSVTDTELLQLSEDLFRLDAQNPFATPLLNLQGKTRSGSQTDMASHPLFGPQTATEAVTSGTAKLLSEMYDNYDADVKSTEPVSQQHLKEEALFFEAILATEPMKKVIGLLVSRGLLPADSGSSKAALKTLWFERYSRSPGATGSSGFEHVFMGEIKNGEPSGFHSWLFFKREEQSGTLDYLGFSRSGKLSDKALLIELPLKWRGMYKPLNSVFIGTSPELEMSLYTMCFYARSERKCPMSGAGFKFFIQTYPLRSRGKTYLGTAYPTFN